MQRIIHTEISDNPTFTCEDCGDCYDEIQISCTFCSYDYCQECWETNAKFCKCGQCHQIICPLCHMSQASRLYAKCESCYGMMYKECLLSADGLIANPVLCPECSPSSNNPSITNPSITNPSITNPSITNPSITNPSITNPRTTNNSQTNNTDQPKMTIHKNIENAFSTVARRLKNIRGQ